MAKIAIKYGGPAPRAPVQIKYEGPNTMGQRIRALRIKRKLSQEQLGELCGVTKSAVSFWECGQSANINLEPFIKLLSVLECDFQWLVWGESGVPAHKIAPPRPKGKPGRPRKAA